MTGSEAEKGFPLGGFVNVSGSTYHLPNKSGSAGLGAASGNQKRTYPDQEVCQRGDGDGFKIAMPQLYRILDCV